ncbi:hypothetical protein [Pseudomonas aeruginosa]|uniref:hypothetical protein n=1 Tax=Pseudomonas aeruginosa TaxID=287 RepID=UPI002D76EC40|nr:hypothetical protein [Pseudomonas aeruginosa]WRS36153.1 hypothetical protein U9S62_08915 [Pseudomonas aeruginosa]WRS37219.1 hypothetical protein U9S62_14465 [Pseudomonas aeruginosa]
MQQDENFAKQAEAEAEAERPEAVAFVKLRDGKRWRLYWEDEFLSGDEIEALMTVAQHERIVKAWIERWKAYIELSAKIAAQRDAALARVAELEKQEPVAHLRASDLERLNQPGIAGSAGSLWNGPREGFVPLYAAPVAQAQHSVPAAWYYDAPSQAEAAIIDIRGMWGEDDCPTYEDVASALRRLLAAAPGCHLSRNALTEAQMRRLYENSTETENERLGFEAFARLIRRAEAVHQIAAAPGKEVGHE